MISQLTGASWLYIGSSCISVKSLVQVTIIMAGRRQLQIDPDHTIRYISPDKIAAYTVYLTIV